MPKKRKKWEQDIAAAQAISGVPLQRSEWWQRLSRATTLEQISVAVHTPIAQDTTDEDNAKALEE